ncbi:MAG: DUF6682 family protein [bacterium]
MGTIEAKSLLDRAATILTDSSGEFWSPEELLDWLNDGQRQVVMLRPDANVKHQEIELDSTDARQEVSADDAVLLIDVPRNMGSDGSSPGRAITFVEKRVLDQQEPGWHESMGNEVSHFAHDPRDPLVFYVYPRCEGYVEIIFSAVPEKITDSSTETIGVPDIFANALIDYILYRAALKDADYNPNDQRAESFRQVFVSDLGMQAQSASAMGPNASSAGRVSTPGVQNENQ